MDVDKKKMPMVGVNFVSETSTGCITRDLESCYSKCRKYNFNTKI